MLSPSGGPTKFKAVWKTKELAKNEHSLELALLASRVASAMHAETSTVVHTVEVERPKLIKETVQEKINQVTKHTSGDEQINLKEYVDLDPGGQDEKKAFEELVKETLGDKVDEVIVSNRMIDSLRVLTMSEQGLSVNMKRIMKAQTSLDSSTDLASGSQQHDSSQQPQRARQSTRQEKKERKGEGERGRSEREQVGREERESMREGQRGRGQEGRKEVREDEEGGSKVVKDVTGWTVVTRNKRQRKMAQIFVKVNGSKATPMDVNLTDDKVEDVMRQIQKDEDVYVTMQGKVFRRNEKL